MADRTAAEVFPPGEFIREELEARAWTQQDLAEILGRSPRLVNEIITGVRSITPETAKVLGDAFGTGAQLWMNLETSYRLGRVKARDSDVTRRARLFDKAPVNLMIRRGWIARSRDIDVLEQQVLAIFGIKNLDEEPRPWRHAARKSTAYGEMNRFQIAWLFRARSLAGAVSAVKFTEARFEAGLKRLRALLASPADVRHVPRVLAESGVRLVVVEHLPKTKIDGACLWLTKTSPVVALSLRYDRIDWFWHTLVHELGHVKNRDGLERHTPFDVDLIGETAGSADKPDYERAADHFAADFLVRQSELESFIARVGPLYSKQKIRAFATRLGVHPGLVVGQLQHRREITYAHNREMLEKVRRPLVEAALTDGWGSTPQVAA